jgi:hypothetical protein
VAEYLEEKRLVAPAQLTYQIKASGINLWIGEQGALDPKFVHDAGFDGLVVLTTSDQQPKRSLLARWVKDDTKIKSMVLVNDRIDDEDASHLSWELLAESMREILGFIVSMQTVRRLSPCSSTTSLSPRSCR